MNSARAIPIKHIFLDIVGFTHRRSVEAQSDVISVLNTMVKDILEHHKSVLPDESVILLPTGDGMCISLLNIEEPYDIHMQITREIIGSLYLHNSKDIKDSRKFNIRIGINSNTDNVFLDINSKYNVAGTGINMASRIMNLADDNQVLVGNNIYDILQHREEYIDKFRKYTAKVKHGVELNVYQYIESDCSGLSNKVPSVFIPKQYAQPYEKLDKFSAYYIAYAIKNRQLLLLHKDYLKEAACCILLYFLAKDVISASERPEFYMEFKDIYKPESDDLDEKIRYYYSLDRDVTSQFLDLLIEARFDKWRGCFEDSYCRFVSDEGKDKLKKDWPDIWTEIIDGSSPESSETPIIAGDTEEPPAQTT